MSSIDNGYIYVLRNHTISNILKINITYKNPEELLRQINNENNFPTPYFILICKNIQNPEIKLKKIYQLLIDYRINKKKDFFRISQEKIKIFFNLIKGKEYIVKKNLCRNMKLCFHEGQQIKHKIDNNIIIATYNYNNNNIIYKNEIFISLSGFCKYHYKIKKPDRTSNTNGWKECEIFKNGKWTSIYDL